MTITDAEMQVVRETPLVLLLQLPDGCCPGRWESVGAFAEIIAAVNNKYPAKTFQLLPFCFGPAPQGTQGLQTIMAVEHKEK